MATRFDDPAKPVLGARTEILEEPLDGPLTVRPGPEIEGSARDSRRARMFRRSEISAQRLEDVLPWTNRMRRPDNEDPIGFYCTNGIRKDAVLRAITSAQNVPGSNADELGAAGKV